MVRLQRQKKQSPAKAAKRLSKIAEMQYIVMSRGKLFGNGTPHVDYQRLPPGVQSLGKASIYHIFRLDGQHDEWQELNYSVDLVSLALSIYFIYFGCHLKLILCFHGFDEPCDIILYKKKSTAEYFLAVNLKMNNE